jgi:hypothetical protein
MGGRRGSRIGMDESVNGEGDGNEGLGFGWCYDGLAYWEFVERDVLSEGVS